MAILNDNRTRTGVCLCGQVRFTVPREPLATVICHCRNCQKQAASAFSVVAVFLRDSLHLQGELRTYEDQGTSGQTELRRFCPNCGSPVLTDNKRAREQGIIFVKAGTLDEVDDLKPTTHYWIKRAHPWLRLPDDVELLDKET